MTTMKPNAMDDLTRSKVQHMFDSLEKNRVRIIDIDDAEAIAKAIRAIGRENST